MTSNEGPTGAPIPLYVTPAPDLVPGSSARFAILSSDDPERVFSGVIADRFAEVWVRPDVGSGRNVAFWPRRPGEPLDHVVARALTENPQEWLVICATRIDAEQLSYGSGYRD